MFRTRLKRIARRKLARLDRRRQRPALFRRARPQLERLPVEDDVVFVAKLLGLDEADVTPRSDVIAPDANLHRHDRVKPRS
jgi:hypothetical protein